MKRAKNGISGIIRSFVNHVKSRVIGGFFTWISLAIALALLKLAFDKTDTLFPSFTQPIIGKDIPGVNVVLVIFILYLTGAAIAHPFGKKLKIKRRIAQLALRIPLLGTLYSWISPIFENLFATPDGTNVKPVVAAEVYMKHRMDLGIKMSETWTNGVQECWVVFFPNPPMVNSGRTVIIPREYVYEVCHKPITERKLGETEESPTEAMPLLMTEKQLKEVVKAMTTVECARYVVSLGAVIGGTICYRGKDGRFLEKI